MQIIAGPRGSGKTTKLIELCVKTPNSVIVCTDRSKVDYIKQMAVIKGYKIPSPITIGTMMCMRKDYLGGGNFLFDDIDAILSRIVPMHCTVFAGTISDELMHFVSHGQDAAM